MIFQVGAPVFHARMGSVFEYFPEATTIVIEDPEATLEQARRELSRLREQAKHRLQDHRLALDPDEFFLDEEEARTALWAHPHRNPRRHPGFPSS